MLIAISNTSCELRPTAQRANTWGDTAKAGAGAREPDRVDKESRLGRVDRDQRCPLDDADSHQRRGEARRGEWRRKARCRWWFSSPSLLNHHRCRKPRPRSEVAQAFDHALVTDGEQLKSIGTAAITNMVAMGEHHTVAFA